MLVLFIFSLGAYVVEILMTSEGIREVPDANFILFQLSIFSCFFVVVEKRTVVEAVTLILFQVSVSLLTVDVVNVYVAVEIATLVFF